MTSVPEGTAESSFSLCDLVSFLRASIILRFRAPGAKGSGFSALVNILAVRLQH